MLPGRFLLPIPLATLAAVIVLAVHHAPLSLHRTPFVSSEEEFEQHMEMLSSTE